MSEVYDKAFKIGVVCTVGLFLILNFLSLIISKIEYENHQIKFDHSGYSWGFPFEMYRNYFGYPMNDIGFTFGGVIANTICVTVFAFIFGFLFKFISSKNR